MDLKRVKNNLLFSQNLHEKRKITNQKLGEYVKGTIVGDNKHMNLIIDVINNIVHNDCEVCIVKTSMDSNKDLEITCMTRG